MNTQSKIFQHDLYKNHPLFIIASIIRDRVGRFTWEFYILGLDLPLYKEAGRDIIEIEEIYTRAIKYLHTIDSEIYRNILFGNLKREVSSNETSSHPLCLPPYLTFLSLLNSMHGLTEYLKEIEVNTESIELQTSLNKILNPPHHTTSNR